MVGEFLSFLCTEILWKLNKRIMKELTAKETAVLEEIIGNELDSCEFLQEKTKNELREKITEEVLFYIENDLN